MASIAVYTWALGLVEAAALGAGQAVRDRQVATACALTILQELRTQAGHRPADFAHQVALLPEQADQLLAVLEAYRPGDVNAWMRSEGGGRVCGRGKGW